MPKIISNTKWKRIRIPLIFVAVIIALAIHNLNPLVLHEKGVCQEMERIQQIPIFAEVTNKYIDSKNHNSKKVVLVDLESSNEFSFYINFEQSGFYDMIEIGDTVKKDNGSLKVRFINKSFEHELNYNCDK